MLYDPSVGMLKVGAFKREEARKRVARLKKQDEPSDTSPVTELLVGAGEARTGTLPMEQAVVRG